MEKKQYVQDLNLKIEIDKVSYISMIEDVFLNLDGYLK